jgi:hypothetical protein
MPLDHALFRMLQPIFPVIRKAFPDLFASNFHDPPLVLLQKNSDPPLLKSRFHTKGVKSPLIKPWDLKGTKNRGEGAFHTLSWAECVKDP